MKTTSEKLRGQYKGQQKMLTAWVDGLRSGKPCVDYECLLTTSLATVMAVESLTIGQSMVVDSNAALKTGLSSLGDQGIYSAV